MILYFHSGGHCEPELRKQLSVLKSYLESFDFVRMSPEDDLATAHGIESAPANASRRSQVDVQVLAESGRAYAIYVNGGNQVKLSLALPVGEYSAEWISTKNGEVEKTEAISHVGGTLFLDSPIYAQDIALRVKRAIP